MKILYARHGDLFQKPEKRVKKEKKLVNNDIYHLVQTHGHDNIMNMIDKSRDDKFKINYQTGKIIKKRGRKSADSPKEETL